MNVMKKRVLTLGYHNKRLQVLPVHWDFPKMTFQQLCYNWKTMNRTEKVPPLSMLNKGHVSHLKKGWSKLRMMMTVMRKVESIGRERSVWIDAREWTVTEVDKMIDGVLPVLGELLHLNNSNRMKELSWKTIYNKMCKADMFGGKGMGRGRPIGTGRGQR